jgi:hypothetical protein
MNSNQKRRRNALEKDGETKKEREGNEGETDLIDRHSFLRVVIDRGRVLTTLRMRMEEAMGLMSSTRLGEGSSRSSSGFRKGEIKQVMVGSGEFEGRGWKSRRRGS